MSFFTWICWQLAEQDFFEGVNPISRKCSPTTSLRSEDWEGEDERPQSETSRRQFCESGFHCSPPSLLLRCYPPRRKLAKAKSCLYSSLNLLFLVYSFPLLLASTYLHKKKKMVRERGGYLKALCACGCESSWSLMLRVYDGSHERKNSSTRLEQPFTCPPVSPIAKRPAMILYFDKVISIKVYSGKPEQELKMVYTRYMTIVERERSNQS